MADESVGYYWEQMEAAYAAKEQHDLDHPGDPRQWWQDCEICAEKVAEEELEIDRAIDNDIYYQEHERGVNHANAKTEA